MVSLASLGFILLLSLKIDLSVCIAFDIGKPPVSACLARAVDSTDCPTSGSAPSSATFQTLWSFETGTGACASRSLDAACRPTTQNKFTTLGECQATCFHEPVAASCVTEGAGKDSEFWLYNALNGTCIPYPPHACPVTANAFGDEAACNAACFRAPCAVGRVSVGCSSSSSDGGFDRWAFEPFAGRCERFRLPNCRVPEPADPARPRLSLNHFASKEECTQLCICQEGEVGCPTPLESIFNRTIEGLVRDVTATRKTPPPRPSPVYHKVAPQTIHHRRQSQPLPAVTKGVEKKMMIQPINTTQEAAPAPTEVPQASFSKSVDAVAESHSAASFPLFATLASVVIPLLLSL